MERQEIKNAVTGEIQKSSEELKDRLKLQTKVMKEDAGMMKKTMREVQSTLEETAIEVTEEIQRSKNELTDQLKLKTKEMKDDIEVLKETTGKIQHQVEEAAMSRRKIKNEITEEIHKSNDDTKFKLNLQATEVKESTLVLKETVGEIKQKLDEAAMKREEIMENVTGKIQESKEKLIEQMKLQTEQFKADTSASRRTTENLPCDLKEANASEILSLKEDISEVKKTIDEFQQRDKFGKRCSLN